MGFSSSKVHAHLRACQTEPPAREGVPPGSPNPDPISDQKMSFPPWLSDLEVVTKRNITCLRKTEIISSLLRLKLQKKVF